MSRPLCDFSGFQFNPQIAYTGVNPFWMSEVRLTTAADVTSFRWPEKDGTFGGFAGSGSEAADRRRLGTPMGGGKSVVAV